MTFPVPWSRHLILSANIEPWFLIFQSIIVLSQRFSRSILYFDLQCLYCFYRNYALTAISKFMSMYERKKLAEWIQIETSMWILMIIYWSAFQLSYVICWLSARHHLLLCTENLRFFHFFLYLLRKCPLKKYIIMIVWKPFFKYFARRSIISWPGINPLVIPHKTMTKYDNILPNFSYYEFSDSSKRTRGKVAI